MRWRDSDGSSVTAGNGTGHGVRADGLAAAIVNRGDGAGVIRRPPMMTWRQGDQAVQANKLPEAEADYQSAVSTAPSDPRPHVAFGKVYLLEQKTDPAELEFMKALDFESAEMPTLMRRSASVYAAQTRLEFAEAQYRAAVALAPAIRIIGSNLGTTLQKADKLPRLKRSF